MKDTVQLSFELPGHLFSVFRQEPEEFLASLRLAAAVKWYETQQVSQDKAAEIAGVSRSGFLAALSDFGVTPFQSTAQEVIREANAAYDG